MTHLFWGWLSSHQGTHPTEGILRRVWQIMFRRGAPSRNPFQREAHLWKIMQHVSVMNSGVWGPPESVPSYHSKANKRACYLGLGFVKQWNLHRSRMVPVIRITEVCTPPSSHSSTSYLWNTPLVTSSLRLTILMEIFPLKLAYLIGQPVKFPKYNMSGFSTSMDASFSSWLLGR